MVDLFAVEAIAGAHLDRIEAIENIELGQRKPIDAAGPDRLSHQRRVEPAAAPLASGVDPELPSPAADLLANLTVEFGRKRPLADPGRIGLTDAEHIADRARSHARSGRRLRRHCV